MVAGTQRDRVCHQIKSGWELCLSCQFDEGEVYVPYISPSAA